MELEGNSCAVPKAESRRIIIPYVEPKPTFRCPNCRGYFTLDEFHSHAARSSNRSSRCKHCENLKRAERRIKAKLNDATRSQ